MLALTVVIMIPRRRRGPSAAEGATIAPRRLSRAGPVAVGPSENVTVALVTWSLVFGRSYRTSRPTVFAEFQPSCSQLPAAPPWVAHSAVVLTG